MLAAEREARRQQIVRDFLRRELADQLALLVAQALLLEARGDARVQQHRVDRLGQVVLCAHLDALDHAVELVERRRHDHRDVAEMRVELQLREDLVAVELGHQDVEQHQVEVPATQQVERLAAVFCEDDGVPLLLQTAAEQKAGSPGCRRRSGSFPAERRERSRRRRRPERSEGLLRAAAYSRSIRSTSSAAPSSSPLLARSSSSRQSSEKRPAPKVWPFDFSVCAARRSSSASPCSCVVRSAATRAGASLEERVDHLRQELVPAELSQARRARSRRGWRRRRSALAVRCPRADARGSAPPPARSGRIGLAT